MPDGSVLAELAQLVDSASRFKAAGQLEAAGQVCSRIVAMTAVPVTDHERQARAEAFNFLAAMAAQREQFGTAMDFFHQAISLCPLPDDVVQYRMNLVRVLLQVQWRERARQEIDRCKRIAGVEILPQVLRLAGLVAREENNGVLALEEYRQAAALLPTDWPVQLELAAILADMALLDDAQAIYARAAIESPQFHAEGHHGVGLCQMRKMECAEAVENFNRALAIDPSISMAHWNRGLCNLTLGNFEDGWRDHEYRFALGVQMAGVSMPARRFQRPMWNGKKLRENAPNRLHLHAEMGLGDGIQFSRYALVARDMGYDVRVEVPRELETLLRDSLPGVKVVPQAKDWPGAFGLEDFDFHAPMMSLPFMVGTMPDTVPYGEGYLKADPDKIAVWAERLADLPHPRVGICWHGRARDQLWVKELDRRRSLDLEIVTERFLGIPGISWVSLDLEKHSVAGLAEYGEHLHDFSDTAALIENLDLVISVDTSVLHLAAGLGKLAWLLNRYDSCWRWLDKGETTPWYDSMRIYRQPAFGNWDTVLSQVAADLKELKC